MIPLCESGDSIKCFFPVWLDPDTDDIPSWAEQISISELFAEFDIMKYPSLWKRGYGTMCVLASEDYSSIPCGQVIEGEFVICNYSVP